MLELIGGIQDQTGLGRREYAASTQIRVKTWRPRSEEEGRIFRATRKQVIASRHEWVCLLYG